MAGLETSDSNYLSQARPGGELPEDTLSLIKLAGQSLLNSAIQEPLEGAAQLINHVVHKKIVPTIHLVKAPQQAEFGSKAWLAQSIGSGLGMVLPFLLTEKATGMTFEKVGGLAETLPLARSIIRPLAMSAEEAAEAGRLAKVVRFVAPSAKKAVDGAIFGAVFTPNAPESKKGFWEQRGINAACSAITFGTMGIASEGIMAGAGKLRVPLADAAFRSSLPGIAFRLGVNGAGGVVGGFASAESNSLLSGRGPASGQEIGQSMISFLVTGAALDAFHMGAERIAESRKPKPMLEQVSSKDVTAIELKEGRHAVNSGTYEVSGDAHVVATGSARIIARGNATVEASGNAMVSATEGARVTARDGAKVSALDSATITALGGAEVWAFGKARVESKGLNKIFARDKSFVKAAGQAENENDLQPDLDSGEKALPEIDAGDEATVLATDDVVVNATDNARVFASDEVYVSASGNAHVEATGRANVRARDHVTVNAKERASVLASGNAVVDLAGNARATVTGWVHATAAEDATVSASGDVQVVATDCATVQATQRAHVNAQGRARVSLGSEASAEACGEAEVRAWGTSTVIARNRAHVIANDHSIVELYDNSSADVSKNSRVIKHSDTAIVTAGGEARNYVPTLTPDRSPAARFGEEKIPGSTAYVSEETYPDDSPIVSNFEKARDAVVQISVARDSGEVHQTIGVGSGFFINREGLIATAYHVVKGADHVEIVMPDGSKATAEVIDVEPGADLALLQAKGRLPIRGGFPITAAGEPVVGMQTVVFGHPGGSKTMAASPGEITDIKRASEFNISADQEDIVGKRLKLTARTQPGNSGGPVIDLKSGQVVGVVNRGGDKAGMTLAIPTEYLLPLLNTTPEARAARLAGLIPSKQLETPLSGPQEGATRRQPSQEAARGEEPDAPQQVTLLQSSMSPEEKIQEVARLINWDVQGTKELLDACSLDALIDAATLPDGKDSLNSMLLLVEEATQEGEWRLPKPVLESLLRNARGNERQTLYYNYLKGYRGDAHLKEAADFLTGSDLEGKGFEPHLNALVGQNLVDPSTLTAIKSANLSEPELRLYRQALEQQAITSDQLEKLLSQASADARHVVQDIWIPSRLAGNTDARFLALLDRAISTGNNAGSAGGSHAGDMLELRRQMAEQAFLNGRPKELPAILDMLKPTVRLRLLDMLSHLAAERTRYTAQAQVVEPLENASVRRSTDAIDAQIKFLEVWLNQHPERRPTAESLAMFDRTVRQLKTMDIDLGSVFDNVEKIRRQFGASALDAFGAETICRLARVESPLSGKNLAVISQFQEALRRRTAYGATDSRLESWRGLRKQSDSQTVARIDERNKLVADLVHGVDADLIEQFSKEDAQWYVGKMRERLNSMLEAGDIRNAKQFFENIDKITEGRTGQSLSKAFAADLVKALEQQGLNPDEIASAAGLLTERKPFLSISGLSDVFESLAQRLSGEYADFVHPVRRRTKMCPCINALVLAEPGQGPSLTYQFHKSTEMHFNLYRMAAESDGSVTLISPNGERSAISQLYGQLRAEKLAWDGKRGKWIRTGEQVEIPKLVLLDDPNARGVSQQNSTIRNRLIQLEQNRNLLVPEEIVGSLQPDLSKDQKVGFERGINYLDIALAQADSEGMKQLASKLAQQVRSRLKNGADSTAKANFVNPVQEIQSAAYTAEHYKTEARLLRALYELSKTETKPDKKAAIMKQEAELFAKNVSYRTVKDFVELSRQLNDELKSKHRGKDLLFVVLEDEGSAHFIHEVFRKANKLNASQFITQADALRLASRGELDGKRLVLLDDNFDYGEQCIAKLNICLDASRKVRERGKGKIDGVTIASLISFEQEAERLKQIDAYRESNSPKGSKPHKTEELFDIDTISSEYSLPLKERPDLSPSQRKEKGITKPSFPSGTNEAGAAEMWPHLMPSNCAKRLVEFAKDLGHFPTRVYSEYYLYRPLVDALPDYFRATNGRNLRPDERAQLLVSAMEHSLTMQENGGAPPWGKHDFLRNQLSSARSFVDALRAAIDTGESSKLMPLVSLADSWYRQVDPSRRPAIAQLKSDELRQDVLKFDVTERTKAGHVLSYDFLPKERPTIKLPSGEVIRIHSLKVTDGELSLNYFVGSSKLLETESVKSAAEGRIIPLLLRELKSSEVKGALAENHYANGHLLAAYLDKIAQFASTLSGAADGEARKEALAKLQDELADKQPLKLVFSKATHRRFALNYEFAGPGVSLAIGNRIVSISGIRLNWADLGKEQPAVERTDDEMDQAYDEPPDSKQKSGEIELIGYDGEILPNSDSVVETLLDEIRTGYMVRLMNGNKAAQAQMLAAYLDRLCKPTSASPAPANEILEIEAIAKALVGA
jgi:hypothetical protein